MARSRNAAGIVSLPLLFAAGSLALVAASARAPKARDGKVVLEVAAVLPMSEGPAGILVLREAGSGTVLPLLVPDAQAMEAGTGGGGAGDLLGRTLEALGARVSEVEIASAEETRGGARVRLVQGGRELELEASPSESVALAIAAGAPIVAARRLLADAGLTPDELEHARERLLGEDPALEL
jgi:hypothetical protein